MNNSKLTNESKEIIRKAKIISESIIEIYPLLAKLESENLENSEEYRKLLERLKTSINLEKNIISRLFENVKQTIIALQEMDEATKEDDGIDMIVNNNKEKLINRRILETIRIYVLTYPEKIISAQLDMALPKDIKETIKEAMETTDLDELKPVLKEKISYYECEKLFKKDLTLFQLILLNLKIKGNYKKDIKIKLINAKYIEIFINPIIENELLEKSFVLPEELFLSMYILAKMNGIANNILESYVYNAKNSIFNYEMQNLLGNALYAYKSLTELELREIRIRSVLSLFTEEEITEENEKFHDLTDNVSSNSFDEIREIIIRSFKSFKKDRALLKKVTF